MPGACSIAMDLSENDLLTMRGVIFINKAFYVKLKIKAERRKNYE
jgi:hypothetical protein